MDSRINLSDLSNLHVDDEKDMCYVDEDIFLIENLRNIPENVRSFQFDIVLFLVAKSGRLQVEINGKQYLVEKDNLLICNNWHFLTNAMLSPDFTCMIMGFSRKRVDGIIASLGSSVQGVFYLNEHPLVKLLPSELPVLRMYHSFLKVKLTTPRSAYYTHSLSCVLMSAVYDLLAVVDRIQKHDTAVVEHTKQGYSITNTIVRNFVMMLADDVQSNRTVKYYADKLCITPKYLSTLCSKETGKVPSQWIKDFLVERIRYLLVSTNKSCKEITNELNFPNTSFFGKFTKQHLGASPLSYRKQQKSAV